MLQSHRRYGDPTWPDPLSALWYAAFFNAHHSDVGNTYTAANTHIRFIYLSFLSPTAFLHPSRRKDCTTLGLTIKVQTPLLFLIWPTSFNIKQCNVAKSGNLGPTGLGAPLDGVCPIAMYLYVQHFLTVLRGRALRTTQQHAADETDTASLGSARS